MDYQQLLRQSAETINQADLDLLMVVSYEELSYELIDLIESPCIIQACTGSELLHHEKISFYLYPQPNAGYFIKEQHLFCAATQAPFSSQLVYPSDFYYDRRGLNLDNPLPTWAERDSLIVFHGSLYKLAGSPLLHIIIKLLQEDKALEFVFMGREDGHLAKMQAAARRGGVESRFHYQGYLLPKGDVKGNVISPEWPKLVSYLKRARLAPNPFPLGGGAARFEAYASGTPAVHLGVRFDMERQWLRQESLVELPALLVPMGTAYSQEEYLSLCHRCLYDETFANQLAAKQLTVARRVCDATAFWQELIARYHDWQGHLHG